MEIFVKKNRRYTKYLSKKKKHVKQKISKNENESVSCLRNMMFIVSEAGAFTKRKRGKTFMLCIQISINAMIWYFGIEIQQGRKYFKDIFIILCSKENRFNLHILCLPTMMVR